MTRKKLYPSILLYAWLAGAVYFVIETSISNGSFYSYIIGFLIFGLIYVYFLNNSCSINLNKDELIICYLPIFIKEKVSLKNISKISVLRGFYSLMSDDKSHPGNNFIPKICYDSIIISYSDGRSIQIDVNLKMGDFKLLKKYIQQRVGPLGK